MIKQLLLLIGLLFSLHLTAQTGIGTTAPHSSAKLEVFSENKGFLPPRMTSSQRNDIQSPAAGLMVYQTDGTSGLYYHNGSGWIYVINSLTNVVSVVNGGTGTTTATGTGSVVLNTSPSLISPTLGVASATSLAVPTITGGSGTTQTLTFKPTSGNGTTGADHIFQVGNNGGTEAMRILNNGNMGIGTTTPGDRLVIGSSLAFHDGGDKVIGIGWSPGGSSKAIVAGYPAEIRLNPSSGKLSFGTDPTSRSVGSTAGIERRMTITSAGNVGIGTENPGATLEIGASNGSVPGYLILNPTTTGTGVEGAKIDFKPAPITTTPAAQTWVIAQVSNDNNPRLRIFPNNSGETKGFSIKDNGNLGIGTATPYNKLHIQSTDATSVYIESTTSDNNGMMILNAQTNQNWGNGFHEFMYFRNSGNNIGWINSSNGSSLQYNSASDYRLKYDLKLFNGMELVNKIKIYDFAWKTSDSRMYGVMAHELQEVIPYLVTGKKDAVDTNGKNIPQGVDYGQLTPILIKAIQEQDIKLIEQQKQIDELIKRLEIIENKK